MNRSLLAVVISQGVLFAIAGGQASAQYPYQRPPLSPYLNLARPGGAFNYYGLVKPYEDYTKTVSGLQQQITTTQQDVQKVATERAGGGTGSLPQTGHLIGFNSGYQRYFQNMAPSASRSFYAVPFSGALSAGVVGTQQTLQQQQQAHSAPPYPAVIAPIRNPFVPRR
jgi:hypothetical protein